MLNDWNWAKDGPGRIVLELSTCWKKHGQKKIMNVDYLNAW